MCPSRKVVVLFMVSGLVGQALAQVQIYPMRLSVNARPGDLVSCSLTVQNLDKESSLEMGLMVVDLAQMEDGRLAIVEVPEGPQIARSVRSCMDWIGLQGQRLDIGPDQGSSVAIEISVPSDAKDLYWAGIVLTRQDQRRGAVAMEYRYLVPVMVQVGARQPSRDVQIGDVGLNLGPEGKVWVYMVVENTGVNYSQVLGTARISTVIGGRQQVLVPRLTFGPVGIMPGARVVLRQDLGQSLDKGLYKVSGSVTVDHRFTERLERQVNLGSGPQLEMYLAGIGQQQAIMSIEPQEALADKRAESRLEFADDGRPMRLLLDQASGSPSFVGKRTLTIRTNILLDLAAQAEPMSPAGGVWMPTLSTVLGQPDRVQLELTGRQVQIGKLVSSAGQVVRLTVTSSPRP